MFMYLFQAEEVETIVNWKTVNKYFNDRNIEAMRAVAKASADRSLHHLDLALTNFNAELQQDPVVHSNLHQLYENLLQKNLLKLVEPYSHVQLSFLSDQLKLPTSIIQTKLSLMILNKDLSGMIDQGSGSLIVLDEFSRDVNNSNTVAIGIYNFSNVCIILLIDL